MPVLEAELSTTEDTDAEGFYLRVPSVLRGGELVLIAAVSILAASAFAQPPAGTAPAPPLVKENATVKVSPHVYAIPDGSVPMVPNVGIIVGSRATMVVDTGLGPRNGQTILREVAKVSKNIELYVATTHYHPEHSLGGAAFPVSAKFVRPKVQQQDMDELGKDIQNTFASRSPLNQELLKDVPYPRADILFDQIGRAH